MVGAQAQHAGRAIAHLDMVAQQSPRKRLYAGVGHRFTPAMRDDAVEFFATL